MKKSKKGTDGCFGKRVGILKGGVKKYSDAWGLTLFSLGGHNVPTEILI